MNYNSKQKATNKIWYLIIFIINSILISMDSDIYVPSFPTILKYFKTTESKIQLILSANFLGICLSSLFYGPISDSIGRKKPLILAVMIFTLGAIGGYFADNISILIFCRFIQGIGSAGVIIIGGAAIFDVYKDEQLIKLASVLNGIGTGAVAFAPLLGGILSQFFGWRINFCFIAISGIILLILTIFFFKESLPQEESTELNIKSILGDYLKITTHLPYVGNSLICALMYSVIMIYTANLSLLFVNYYHISEHNFLYYQFSIMLTFMIASISCTKIIPFFGTEFTKKLGINICLLGVILLLIVSYYFNKPVLICLAMAVFTAGVALSIGIFGVYSMEFFPELKATVSALGTAYRLLITSLSVTICAHLFNGTILPIAWFAAIITIISYLIYLIIQKPTIKILNK